MPIKPKAKSTPKPKEQAILVTTAYRGVFFGFARKTDGNRIKLRAGRCCISWPEGTRGFPGLASIGPQSGSRVGPAADIELRDITSVAECSPAAVDAWEKFPCGANPSPLLGQLRLRRRL